MNFKQLHPSAALVYFIGLIILIFNCTHPLALAISVAGVTALAFYYTGMRRAINQLKFILPMGILISIVNPLLVRRGATVLFYLLGNPVTLEATAYGVYQSALIITVVILFAVFNHIIDQQAFLYLCANRAPRTAFILSMALQSAARFKKRASDLMDVQQTKGISLLNGRLTARIRVALLLFGAFTVRSLEEGLETAEVLKARDYGNARRTHFRLYGFTKRDVFFIGMELFLFVAILLVLSQGAWRFEFYPRMTHIFFTPAEMGLLCIHAAYVSLPLLYELKNTVIRSIIHGY